MKVFTWSLNVLCVSVLFAILFSVLFPSFAHAKAVCQMTLSGGDKIITSGDSKSEAHSAAAQICGDRSLDAFEAQNGRSASADEGEDLILSCVNKSCS